MCNYLLKKTIQIYVIHLAIIYVTKLTKHDVSVYKFCDAKAK